MPETDLKMIALPDEPDMWLRMVSTIDSRTFTHAFFPHLLRYAGKQRNGPGVALAVQVALSDYIQTLAPSIANVMETLVQPLVMPIIEALVDDEEVRADALDYLNRAEAKRQQALRNRPPSPPQPTLTDDEKRSLMRQIKHLARLYNQYLAAPYPSSIGFPVGVVNPFHGQTLNGLFLECYDNAPSKIWTPWGYWHLAGKSYVTDLNQFMSHFKVRVHTPGQQLAGGYYGPVYAILAIDGEQLPKPILQTDKRQRLDYAATNADWKRFFNSC